MTTLQPPLPGELTATKTRHGDPDTLHFLCLTGRTLYLIQQTLRHAATHAPSYTDTREAVLLGEDLRLAIIHGTTEPKLDKEL